MAENLNELQHLMTDLNERILIKQGAEAVFPCSDTFNPVAPLQKLFPSPLYSLSSKSPPAKTIPSPIPR